MDFFIYEMSSQGNHKAKALQKMTGKTKHAQMENH